MADVPIPADQFDYHDRTQLEAMYKHFRSCGKLGAYLRSHGVKVANGTLEKWRRQLGIEVAQESYRRRGEPKPELTPEETVEQDRAVLRLQDELKEVKSKYAAACKSGNLHEDILAVAREEMGKISPQRILAPKAGGGKTCEDAILAWSDWHGGEVVDYDVMQGYNAYDPAIMCRRAQYTVDHTLDILFDCHRGTTFGTLYVFDLGDSINGDHLEEQLATNALPVFEAMRMVVAVKSQALAELSAHLPVVYICVPGNHGRRGKRMQWKLPTETADWLIAEMISDRVAGNDRIECVVPKSWSYGVTVCGWNHALNHGFTSAKGGYGGISWYSFQRADGQKTAVEAAHGKRVHHRWYGHIHQKAEVPMTDGDGEQHIVGSLKGGDEYALEGLNRFSEPAQKLVGVHDKYGVTWRYPLNVKHGDECASRYEEIAA